MLRGWSGALVALLGGSLPSAVMAVALTALYEHWSQNSRPQMALQGAMAAAVAIMVITGVTIIRPHWRSTSRVKLLIFIGGAFTAFQVFLVPTIRVLVAAAILGCFWPAHEAKG